MKIAIIILGIMTLAGLVLDIVGIITDNVEEHVIGKCLIIICNFIVFEIALIKLAIK